ncbi:MAG TPA: hypothetical protein VMW43_05220, partial [Bacteroidota bacterium]|nr:hypothetical protein [Bacteroidota bacterium]
GCGIIRTSSLQPENKGAINNKAPKLATKMKFFCKNTFPVPLPHHFMKMVNYCQQEIAFHHL